MNHRTGDLYSIPRGRDVWLGCTTNGVLDSKGNLVMGKGNALTIAQMYPDLPRLVGWELSNHEYSKHGAVYRYNLLIVQPVGVICFQSKMHWRDDSPLDLIEESLLALDAALEEHPIGHVHMPMPGIGNGGVDFKTVEELIDRCIFSDRVTFWTR